jgi:hypothetical protein
VRANQSQGLLVQDGHTITLIAAKIASPQIPRMRPAFAILEGDRSDSRERLIDSPPSTIARIGAMA